MKRKIFFLIMFILFITGCSSNNFSKLNYNEFKELIDKKESFVICLTDEIDDGNTLKNTLLNVSKKNNIKTYYLNTDKLNENDLKALKDIIYFDETNFIAFIKEGNSKSVLTYIDNTYISEKELEKELINQEFIKKT